MKKKVRAKITSLVEDLLELQEAVSMDTNSYVDMHEKPEAHIDQCLQRHIQASCFKNKDLLKLFIKYNTALPSNAAIKRVFLIGKDLLKAEKAGLSDSPFEMLLFSKVNS